MPNLYGFGEHTDAFHLNTTDYTRTLWSKDAYGVPEGTNLYGNHPVYFDYRGSKGTHGVFMLNSNGMDFKVNKTGDKQYLEYNMLGGVVDLYFLAGPTPQQVAAQYSEIVGKPAMMPYWGFGYHQCRYGYRDVFNVAEVVQNYSLAKIPLETMWTDIDYMDRRKVFTLDQQRFPIEKMRELIDYLHDHNQHYVVMVDPAVAYLNNSAYYRGVEADIFLKFDNGTIYNGVVWPGVTVFPDWFHPNISNYWVNEFAMFFNKDTGVDIDALWIDMNEASNFACDFPCSNPQAWAKKSGNPPTPPPVRDNPRPLIGFPEDFQPTYTGRVVKRQDTGDMKGLPGRNLLVPGYAINNIGGTNAEGGLSNHTIRTDLHHYNGLVEYDTHNIYGSMMSEASREAMLYRRPGLRPMIITRSTFAGAGAKVGKWLGDNVSTWFHYRISISGLMQFASIYQIPMIGSDVCGFAGNTTEQLCARWAMLGAFSPFYRNHNGDTSNSQEFYLWPSVADAARKAMHIRYRLLDYIYTALYVQSTTGVPLISPMFFLYPHDEVTASVELQYFFGPSILVSPVTEENATSVEVYLPKDTFYDLLTLEPITSTGGKKNITGLTLTDIPLHIRSGSVVPMRITSAMTTTELRTHPFEIIVAPDHNGYARGELYLDDGVSIVQKHTSMITFYHRHGVLVVDGDFGYSAIRQDSVVKFTFLNIKTKPAGVRINNDQKLSTWSYDAKTMKVVVEVKVMLNCKFSIKLR